MSFSKTVKDELLEIKIDDDQNALAFLCGLIKSIGKIEKQEKNFICTLTTDVFGLYDFTNRILKQLYGDYAELEITEKSIINKTVYYNISLPKQSTLQILLDTGIVKQTANGYEVLNELDDHIFKNDGAVVAYIRAVYLTCSTSSIKISEQANVKSTSGYHLEFISHSKDFLQEFSEILAKEGIFAKLIERKNVFVLYLKDAQSICDLLALIGAHNSVLILQNEIATREMRNAINRQTNCVSANISKTVNANLKQLEAIEIISQTIGLDSLPEELEQVALLRLANTEETLEELTKLSNLGLTKSGINHRLRKLIKIAEMLKQ